MGPPVATRALLAGVSPNSFSATLYSLNDWRTSVASRFRTTRARFDLKDRGSARQRGYDARWQKVRDYHIRANPLCVKCEERGRTVAGKDVDHIIPFDGLSDPKRLDGCNLQTLCRACHNAKTARQGAR